jgi:hypothetical protein
MRKVRTSGISNSSPALMFSRGVEQIVSDHIVQRPKFDDQELRAMQRSPSKHANNGSLLGFLVQQLFWPRAGRRA